MFSFIFHLQEMLNPSISIFYPSYYLFEGGDSFFFKSYYIDIA